MKPLVALLVSVSLAACFPNSAKHRTYAKVAEGGALVGGIAMLAVVNTGADCDNMQDTGDGCRADASVLGTVGLGLILAGMVGFIATVSTSPDDKPEAPAANTLTKTPIPATDDGTSAPKTPTVTPAAPALK